MLIGCFVGECATIGSSTVALAAKGRAHTGNAQGNETRIILCHKGHTMTVGAGAIDVHLGHGDTVGECGRDGNLEQDTDSDGVHDYDDTCPNSAMGAADRLLLPCHRLLPPE